MFDVPTAHDLLRRTRPRHSRDGYPPEVRERVTALAEAEIAAGHSVSATAQRLGLAPATLGRWLTALQDTSPSLAPAFFPVALPGNPSTPTAAGARAGLAVVSPSGFRIEGLDLDGAIAALRRSGTSPWHVPPVFVGQRYIYDGQSAPRRASVPGRRQGQGPHRHPQLLPFCESRGHGFQSRSLRAR